MISSDKNIGNYKLIKSLGKGGMGEVWLAEDTLCERPVALKRIKPELQKFPTIRKRFLREARIAAQLSHPSIIPIFSICDDPEKSFYTMTYVEGSTLKELLKEAKNSDQMGSIPHLTRIFLSICQAIAYAHSKKILHRDVKPENVIVGKFGEVMILDWGLAQVAGEENDLEEIPAGNGDQLTRPGKVVGTLAYLAPERANDKPASEQSDLYSLGVILFQILTLKMPFKRHDLESYQKRWMYEEVPDPIETAPDRDIPHVLSQMTLKALSKSPENRYKSVHEMLIDLEAFIEGRPDWIAMQSLDIHKKEDWEFQELILLAKHMAIARMTDMEWVNFMISKSPFPGNSRIETTVQLSAGSQGIGFLIGSAEPQERKELMDGFCLWIGAVTNPGCKLFRNNIDLMSIPSVALEIERPYQIRIEKHDHHLKLYIDDVLRLHYISQTPLLGTKVGLLLRDDNLTIAPLKMSIGSQNVMVSCLAIPDAFLASKEYERALYEYRKIATSFPGRMEGREAIYRAGTTLTQEKRFDEALEEFGKLHGTAGAPLEYLGKSIVYQALEEWDEEAKCLELAIRKFAKHPLYPRVVEHLIFRLHESSSHQRKAAYHLALLALRHIPEIFSNPDHKQILVEIEKQWENLSYFPSNATALKLAFLLERPITLVEIIHSGEWVEEAFFGLLELGAFELVRENPQHKQYPSIGFALEAVEGGKPHTSILSPRLKTYLFNLQFDRGHLNDLVHHASDPFMKIQEYLATHQFEEASRLFEEYPLEELMQESSPLFIPYGCYLWALEGEEIAKAHFSGIEEMRYPPVGSLLAYYILGKIQLTGAWYKEALYWEKVSLLRQLLLLGYALGNEATISQCQAFLSSKTLP